ncbi:MAG TPA: hypothetical protein VF092_11110 [Longimicrobium sp.]
MIPSSLRRLSIAVATLALAACGHHLDGKYATSNGMMQVEFKGDNAYVTIPMAGTTQVPFEMDGDRVILKNAEGGNMVLTRNSDGSLAGPMGDLRKVDD